MSQEMMILIATCSVLLIATIVLAFSQRSKNLQLGELAALQEAQAQEADLLIHIKTKELTELTKGNQTLEVENSAIKERASRVPELESDVKQLQQNLGSEQRTNEALSTRMQEQTKAMNEKIALLESAREQMKESFENLANQILEEKGQKFNKEANEKLTGLLNPLREQVGSFQKTVTDNHLEDAKERSMLREQLNNLKDLNQQLSDDALGLTKALRGDSKARGQWGELALERLLEASGLKQGEHYDFNLEVSKKDESGKAYRPDAIVNLPENRQIVVDSKVALNAYKEYCDSDSESDKLIAMGRHQAAIKGHIKNLSGKQYDQLEGVNSLDVVLMFIPIEAAFIDAINHDDSLFEHALGLKIIMVCPSTLLATLKTIAMMWKVEDRNSNAEEIARQAGALYDKFTLFAESLEKVGGHLDKARESHATAMNRLSSGKGHIVGRIENLKKMGAAASKQLPEHLLLGADE